MKVNLYGLNKLIKRIAKASQEIRANGCHVDA